MQIFFHLILLRHQNTKTRWYKFSKNHWVMALFEIFRSARGKLQFTVALDHPVVQTTPFQKILLPTKCAGGLCLGNLLKKWNLYEEQAVILCYSTFMSNMVCCLNIVFQQEECPLKHVSLQTADIRCNETCLRRLTNTVFNNLPESTANYQVLQMITNCCSLSSIVANYDPVIGHLICGLPSPPSVSPLDQWPSGPAHK